LKRLKLEYILWTLLVLIFCFVKDGDIFMILSYLF